MCGRCSGRDEAAACRREDRVIDVQVVVLLSFAAGAVGASGFWLAVLSSRAEPDPVAEPVEVLEVRAESEEQWVAWASSSRPVVLRRPLRRVRGLLRRAS